MRHTADAYMLVGADLTLAKIPKPIVQAWFEVRHLIYQATGLQRGIVVTSLESHTLFGVEKNLRTSTAMMFLKNVPTNPCDRSLLKRYFDPRLLRQFERVRETDPQLVLVWDPRYAPHGHTGNSQYARKQCANARYAPNSTRELVGFEMVSGTVCNALPCSAKRPILVAQVGLRLAQAWTIRDHCSNLGV
jgi:hypothetical protein